MLIKRRPSRQQEVPCRYQLASKKSEWPVLNEADKKDSSNHLQTYFQEGQYLRRMWIKPNVVVNIPIRVPAQLIEIY